MSHTNKSKNFMYFVVPAVKFAVILGHFFASLFIFLRACPILQLCC